jgi:acyl-CoA synthetase (AMP-forming)/AMP-acid ligase II
LVEENELSGGGPDGGDRPKRYRAIVNCGRPVIGMEVEVRSDTGEILPDRGIGKIFVRGSSVMHSYFRDEESTRACLSPTSLTPMPGQRVLMTCRNGELLALAAARTPPEAPTTPAATPSAPAPSAPTAPP